MRKPKVGDIVIYQEEYNDHKAIIVKVNEHDACDLHVMISTYQGESGEIGCWSWPDDECLKVFEQQTGKFDERN